MRPALAAVALLVGVHVSAQVVPDARTVPAGALRISFTPQYLSWDEVFDEDGTVRRLGYHYLTDTTVRLLPSAIAAQTAVRSLTGDDAWLLRAGRLDPRLDADRRRFPFDFSLGLTSWLTVRATIPLVTTTMNAFPTLDTTGVNAGLATFDGTLAQAAANELLIAADQLAAGIAAGQYGCPGSPQCASAEALEARARQTATDLVLLSASPLQPVESSGAGQAIADLLAQIDADLQTLGESPIGVAVPLPEAALDTAGLNAVLGDLGLSPLEPSKHTRKLGDIELGARMGLVSRPGLRLLADVTVRLPTASSGRPLDPIELAPGDRQLDLALSLEGAVESNALSLWMRAGVEMQRPSTVQTRLTAPDDPLAPAATLTSVTRDPGDLVQVSVWPGLRLTEGLRVMLTGDWQRRGADQVTMNGSTLPGLEAGTRRQSLAFGGGIWYRATRGRHADALPIEAGLVYRTVFSGEGGMTPKSRRLDFGLRLYYGL